MNPIDCDVAIIGGGPGGATTGTLIRKYRPDLAVAIFERERFPRDHVGESQLPPIGVILDEMGCWDKVEAANFPIKIGATYRWGRSDKLWDFEFVAAKDYQPSPRPRSFGEQERRLAMQVDRAVYDRILLDHAAETGCRVEQGCKVARIGRDGDRVTGLTLADGRTVSARHYVDASGGSGILRRAMGVQVDAPTKLQNIALWDYWTDAKWSTRFHGEATRVLVLSIGCGWIWYIPLSRTRTSIGFICPASFYKERGQTPAELYAWALAQEPLLADLLSGASASGQVQATKDWSFLAERMCGENWFLVGEAGGFADPILAAGLTLTHTSAREAAYSIIALEDGSQAGPWLRSHFDHNQRARINQHIRFADFWYSANGIFTDLQDYTAQIARDSGLDLDAQRAFQWLGTGGFTHDILGQAAIGGHDLSSAKQVFQRLVPGKQRWAISDFNRFRLNLAGATTEEIPAYVDGKVLRIKCHRRGSKRLPVHGAFAWLIEQLKKSGSISKILQSVAPQTDRSSQFEVETYSQYILQALEVMVADKWVTAKLDPRLPRLNLESPDEGRQIHTNLELNPPAQQPRATGVG